MFLGDALVKVLEQEIRADRLTIRTVPRRIRYDLRNQGSEY